MAQASSPRAESIGGDEWRRPVAPAPGPVRFARYAYGPNSRGYCGPDEVDELFAQATAGGDDERLRALARQFEGAYPYLELIAGSNSLRDPLDPRVVEAYWLGTPAVDAVSPRALGSSLEDRFRPRLRADAWRWLAGQADHGAVPAHAFHVLDVFPKVGLLRTGGTDDALAVMDACRIRWGRVLERDGDHLVVSVVPLAMRDGRLQLDGPRVERIRGWRDGATFVEDVQPGDAIAIHWDWACERLDAGRLTALRASTIRQLEVANRIL